MKIEEKGLIRLQRPKLAPSSGLPEIDLVYFWLLGEKCKPVIIRNSDVAFHDPHDP